MSKLLYITANPKKIEDSFSLSVGKEFLTTYRAENPSDEIVELDLFKSYVPEIDEDVLNGWGKLQKGVSFEDLSENERNKVAGINALTELFMSADKYVFVTPMWNLSFPPRVKAFIDTILMAGKTFKYTEHGPVGLLTGRKAVHIQARGGIYSEGPAAAMEFGDRYLRSVLSFIGIHDVETVAIEGMAYAPEQASEIHERAIEHAKAVAVRFGNVSVSVS